MRARIDPRSGLVTIEMPALEAAKLNGLRERDAAELANLVGDVLEGAEGNVGQWAETPVSVP